jgi:hypothetical protein
MCFAATPSAGLQVREKVSFSQWLKYEGLAQVYEEMEISYFVTEFSQLFAPI